MNGIPSTSPEHIEARAQNEALMDARIDQHRADNPDAAVANFKEAATSNKKIEDEASRSRRIEDRKAGDEVAQLDIEASDAIYGTRDRQVTVKNPSGKGTHKRTVKGKPGRIDQIRKDKIYGNGQKERDQKAKEYKSQVEELFEEFGGRDGDGSLTKAKLAMDLREEAWSDAETAEEKILEKTHHLIEQGADPQGSDNQPSPKERATAFVRKRMKDSESNINDEVRVHIIKNLGENGVFTREDYEKAKKEFTDQGGDLSKPINPVTPTNPNATQPTNPNSNPNTGGNNPPEPDMDEAARSVFYMETPDDLIRQAEYARDNASTPEERAEAQQRIAELQARRAAMTPEQRAQLETHNTGGLALLQDLGNSLNTYAKLQAKYETKMTPFGKGKLEKARQEYETLRQTANNRTAQFLRMQGFTNEQIIEELIGQDFGEYTSRSEYESMLRDRGLSDTEIADRLNAEGPGDVEVSRGEAGLVRDVTRQEMARKGKESRFINWWMKMNKKGKKGMIAKAAVMVPVGVAAGVVAGPLIGAGVGAAAAGIASKRLATGMIRNRVNNTAGVAESAQVRTRQRHQAQMQRMNQEAHRRLPREGKDYKGVSDVTSAHSDDARATNRSNTKRAAVSMGVGLAAGAIAGELADSMLGGGGGDSSHLNHNAPQNGPTETDIPYTDKSLAPSTDVGPTDKDLITSGGPNSQGFGHLPVAPGSGFEDSLQNKYGLSDAQARGAYEAMRSDLQGANGTYQIGPGNIGVSSPGDFHVPSDAQQDLRSYLESINKKK